MTNSKSASVPLAAHFQLCKDQSPKTDSEKPKMEKIPYSNAIGFVMYLMVSTRPDIVYAVLKLMGYVDSNYANDRDSRRTKHIDVFFSLGPRSPLGCDDHQDPPPLDLVQEPLWLGLILAFVAVVDLALSGLDL
ncbi:Retrovirus-related Pol polyprotein from transposon TNT 1-94 [Sesamum angolense]|uniref:Retrovirus-related Pol polyprotein from transposon TNT 1-94 n=1 Tax=Sesamum angolense TaxID=2727404 RepID=A0AAE1T3W8_9LAMI|nr:Retrovirus-related Pol polyprotein from transposon TNT 1-94 [Sesamum angolense]